MGLLARSSVWLDWVALVLLLLGVIFGYGNLQNWFLKSDRQDFLNWVLKSESGLSIDAPAAQAFVRDFPPPDIDRLREITHVTKHVLRLENGGVLEASINYLYKDNSRSSYVATLPEIRDWAKETIFGWVAWFLTMAGLLIKLFQAISGVYHPKSNPA